jgi:hypothetical protein
MLRRIGVLTSLAVGAAMFAGVSSAQAADAGVCVFDGLAGNLENEDPLTSEGIPPASVDATDANGPLDIEQGTYNFSSSGGALAQCAGVFKTSTVVFPPTNVTITSAGFYDNIVCGTGTAHDLDGSGTTVTSAVPPISITGAGYEIPFSGGVGPLLIGPGPVISNEIPGVNQHGTGATDDGLDDSHDNRQSLYNGLGLVQITPGRDDATPPSAANLTSRDNCVDPRPGPGPKPGVDEFEVKGYFVAYG